MSHIYCTWFHSVYIVSPPSVSVIPVEATYFGGDTVTLTCTVIANASDPRTTAYIRWRRNKDINTTMISPTPVNDMYIINYAYPLTINSINSSHAGQYSCTARIRSNGITNVMGSDTVVQDSNIKVIIL